jgi:hypothetical protein
VFKFNIINVFSKMEINFDDASDLHLYIVV